MQYQRDEAYVLVNGLYLMIKFRETFPMRNGKRTSRYRLWVVSRSFIIRYDVTSPIRVCHEKLVDVSIITNVKSTFSARLFRQKQAKSDIRPFLKLYFMNAQGIVE